jgi:hypothetical protein
MDNKNKKKWKLWAYLPNLQSESFELIYQIYVYQIYQMWVALTQSSYHTWKLKFLKLIRLPAAGFVQALVLVYIGFEDQRRQPIQIRNVRTNIAVSMFAILVYTLKRRWLQMVKPRLKAQFLHKVQHVKKTA